MIYEHNPMRGMTLVISAMAVQGTHIAFANEISVSFIVVGLILAALGM